MSASRIPPISTIFPHSAPCTSHPCAPELDGGLYELYCTSLLYITYYKLTQGEETLKTYIQKYKGERTYEEMERLVTIAGDVDEMTEFLADRVPFPPEDSEIRNKIEAVLKTLRPSLENNEPFSNPTQS